MMKSQITKFIHSSKAQKYKYFEHEILIFLEIKLQSIIHKRVFSIQLKNLRKQKTYLRFLYEHA